MGSLEFMNQDGEWENWTEPTLGLTAEEIFGEPVETWITCQLCNEPVMTKDIKVSFDTEHQWSCNKCQAVNG